MVRCYNAENCGNFFRDWMCDHCKYNLDNELADYFDPIEEKPDDFTLCRTCVFDQNPESAACEVCMSEPGMDGYKKNKRSENNG